MTDVIAVIAPGEMGSAIGGRLRERGAKVLTSLHGRGAASAARASRDGLIAIESDAELVAQAQFVFSIVPPAEAVGLAERLRDTLARSSNKPIYVDCNAVAPETAVRIGEVLTGTGCRYVDGGIIGSPPKPNYSPKLYVSGDGAKAVERLNTYGLTVRVVDGPVGAASALKMSYAGITKGLTAIGAAMMLGATHGSCADALHRELSESQPQLLAWLSRQVRQMFPKAYRWVAEMEEIADFVEASPGSRDMYLGAARLYQQIADAVEERAPGDVIEGLAAFCELTTAAAARKSA